MAASGAVNFKDITAGRRVEEIERGSTMANLPDAGNRQASRAQDLLGIAPIVLQPVAVRAAADDVKALLAQGILHDAAILRDIFEQQNAVPTGRLDPFELFSP